MIMREEYLHHLGSILHVREIDCNVRKQQEETKKLIDIISQNLLNDNILIDHFICIVKESEEQLKETNNYSKHHLEKLNEKYILQSEKLKKFWTNYLSLKTFFKSYSFFKEMADAAENYQGKHFSLKNMKDIEKHHSWIKDVLNNKNIIINAWESYNQLKMFLNKYPIFIEIRKEFSAYETKLSLSKSLDEIKVNHKWIIEMINNKNILENAWNDYKSLSDFFNKNALFKEMSSQLSKYAKYFSSDNSLDAIKKHHEWIKKVLKDKSQFIKILNDLHDLMKFLSDKGFKGLENELIKQKNNISMAKNINDMKNSHSWINSLISKKHQIEFVQHNIKYFWNFINSKNKFFDEKNWILALEEESAKAIDQNDVLLLNKKVNERLNLINSIKSITEKWDELNNLILEKDYDNQSTIEDLKKMHKLFSTYEKDGKLNDSTIDNYLKKVIRKTEFIKHLMYGDYPKLGFVDLD